MRMYDLIQKKRDGKELSNNEITYIIKHYTKGTIPDYQIAALLMAIYFQGLTKEETLNLTLAMADSGDRLNLSGIHGKTVDKHSTGGVGDKTSLILAPMVAAVGVPVAKMSGRGLGHTGGTIDKLESFPGFSTSVAPDDFIRQVNDIGIAIAGQTANLAPADKKLYALRDVTATVDQMSLIASSIMSKKLAAGAASIVLDVKTGSGAFMKTLEDSEKLANAMVDIGNRAGRKTTAIISDMNQPLGYAVGNSLEVIEAIETLSGNGPSDLTELCITLGAHMLYNADAVLSPEEGRPIMQKTITDGSALHKLAQFVHAQGGNEKAVHDTSLLPHASIQEPLQAPVSGYIQSIHTDEAGMASLILGGGRETKDSIIDLSVGFVLCKKIGDYVKKDEPLAIIHGNDRTKIIAAKERLLSAYVIGEKITTLPPLIHKIISADEL